MKADTQERIQSVRAVLAKRYPKYSTLPAGERVLLAMSVLANDLRVKEQGTNAGPWVAAILDAAGLGTGFAWCAAAINFCRLVAQTPLGPAKGVARVHSWYTWAKNTGRLKTKPKRGSLCLWLNEDLTGHIGVVAGSPLGMVRSIEGNTSGNDAGSQRDGDGIYTRTRRQSTWEYYIDLD